MKGPVAKTILCILPQNPFDIVIFASLTMFFGKFDALSTIQNPRRRCGIPLADHVTLEGQ